MTAVLVLFLSMLLPGAAGQQAPPAASATFKVSGRLIGRSGNQVTLVPSAAAGASSGGCGVMAALGTRSDAGSRAFVAQDRTYEVRVPPGQYALCVSSRGSDTVMVLAGPFAVTVSERDLILDINVSQTTVSAPGGAGGRGTIRTAVSGLTLSGRVLVSGSVPARGARGGQAGGRGGPGGGGATAPPAAAIPGATAHLVSREAGNSQVRRIATARVDMQSATEGAFEFWNLPAGPYDLLVEMGGPNQMAALGRTSIDLRKDAHDVTVTVRAGFDVTGFVTLDGRPGAPAGLRISLQPDASAATVTGLPAQVSRLASEMAPDGTFVIHGVLEGTYSVVVGPAQPEVSVADIRQGGASVRATGLRVGPSPMPQTEIVLNSAAAGPGGR